MNLIYHEFLSENDILKCMSQIRFLDVICISNEFIESTRVSSFVKRNCIEFHLPLRRKNIYETLIAKEPVLLKYCTDFAEVSSEWCLEDPRDKRVSSVVGLDIQITNAERTILNRNELISHLNDTVCQNTERIDDEFRIEQLDENFCNELLDQIAGFRVDFASSEFNFISNLLTYRSNADIERTAEKLKNIAKNCTHNKYSIAADLLVSALNVANSEVN